MADDTDQIDEYGYPLSADTTAPVTAPPLAAGAPAPVSAPSPVTAPVVAPPVQTQPRPAPLPIMPPTSWGVLRPGSTAAEAQSRIDLVSMMQNSKNLERAQAAVDAAMHFQALRGYQEDISAGKAPAEALARWAPLLYMGPKSSSLGQAGAFIRGTRAPAAPRPQNIGGVGWVFDPQTQSMRQVTPTPAKEDPDALEYQNTRRAMDAIEKSLLDPKRDTAEDPVKQQRLRDLGGVAQAYQQRLNQKRAGIARPAAIVPPAAAQPAGTVIRRTKEGRRAVFDAQTRKFIRYAE